MTGSHDSSSSKFFSSLFFITASGFFFSLNFFFKTIPWTGHVVLLPPHPLRHLLSPDSSYSNRCEERSVSIRFDLHFPGDLFRWVAHMHVHLFIFFEEMIIQILCEFLKICCHSGYWGCPSLRFKSLIWYVFQTLPHFLGCSTPLNCVLCRQSIQVGRSLTCLFAYDVGVTLRNHCLLKWHETFLYMFNMFYNFRNNFIFVFTLFVLLWQYCSCSGGWSLGSVFSLDQYLKRRAWSLLLRQSTLSPQNGNNRRTRRTKEKQNKQKTQNPTNTDWESFTFLSPNF